MSYLRKEAEEAQRLASQAAAANSHQNQSEVSEIRRMVKFLYDREMQRVKAKERKDVWSQEGW